MKNENSICVIGLGYIGLPTSVILAECGYKVCGVDTSTKVLDSLRNGRTHIAETNLNEALNSQAVQENFRVSDTPSFSDVFIIAVPTPFNENHEPNIEFIMEAVESIVPYLRPGNMIILESTSPVGTTEKINNYLKEMGVDISELYIAHCPERVLPGKIMKELLINDRIIGGQTKKAGEKVAEFYREFIGGSVHITDARTAELCKLVENSYRDVNIAFANELSMISDTLGIDVWELIDLANCHPRVNILRPGAGVGGHCIAVDPWFIVYSDAENSKLIRRAREVNICKADWVFENILSAYENLKTNLGREPILACFGLAFKPDVDDLRESPALQIFHKLLSRGINPLAVEPNLYQHDSIHLTDVDEACKEADLIAILVPHNQFSQLRTSAEVLYYCGKGTTQ